MKDNRLQALLDTLRAKTVDLDDELPTFGGPDIENTVQVWSWDATHAIVGTCSEDLALVPRSDLARPCEVGHSGWLDCENC